MQGIKASVADRGSLLEWRWTPFFALLTLALVASLITALLVPSTPAQFFATPEMARGLGKRSGIPTQTGLGSTLTNERDDSNDPPSAAATSTRRGSLQRLTDRSRGMSARPAPPPRATAKPVRRTIPAPPEPELHQSASNDRDQEDDAPDQADEPEEEEAEAPAGAGGAGQDDSDDEEGPPAPPTPDQRPKLLNPGVLRTIPGLQRN